MCVMQRIVYLPQSHIAFTVTTGTGIPDRDLGTGRDTDGT